MPLPRRLLAARSSIELFDAATTRLLEQQASAALAPHALMERAGRALLRVARAVAPHARAVWVAAGPGNNGGDGLVLATLLHEGGIPVSVSLVGHDAARAQPADAAWALARALAAGVPVSAELPAGSAAFDLVVDALLGIGQKRAPRGAIEAAIRRLNESRARVLAVDVPTGLDADTGAGPGDEVVRATHTLTLLTPKPGLFTGVGREACGDIWFDALGCEALLEATPTSACCLAGVDFASVIYARRGHLAHKGSYGDVHVAGGAPGMVGAAFLAAHAASAAGAGRVLVHALSGEAGGMPAVDVRHPELMLRPAAELLPALRHDAQATVVAGCGGGAEVARALPGCFAHAARLVLDADALNAIARDPALRKALRQRADRGRPTVLTPHPLEAARLLATDAQSIQADRLSAARQLAADTGAVVVLKGSGTIVADPAGRASINPSGDARLATAGTGDVLAGWLGGTWAACSGGAGRAGSIGEGPAEAWRVAVASVFVHGAAVDGTRRGPLLASDLVAAMGRVVDGLPEAGDRGSV